MPGEQEKPRRPRGRPPKRELRTTEDLDEVILKVANSPRLIKTPSGEAEMRFFEINVLNIASEKPSQRLSGKAFVGVVLDATKRKEDRQAREQSITRMKAQSGGL